MGKQAIEGKRLNAFGVDPFELVVVGLDTKDGESHPLWDERINLPVDESMVRNIMVYGVLEPVLVRKDGDRVLVIDGRQRVRCAREANRRLDNAGSATIDVPCMVRRGDDAGMFGVMVSANEVRVSDALNTKLSKLSRYMQMGKSREEAAVTFGVEEKTIDGWLSLIEAGPELKKAVSSGAIGATAATKIARLPRDQQAEAVKEATANGKATVQEAEKIAKRKENPNKQVHNRPGLRTLKKLSKVNGPWEKVDAGKLLDWVLGEVDSAEVPHLSAMLKKLEKNDGND